MLTVVVEKQSFSATFAFVIAAAWTNGVHIAPIRFHLRVNDRITIDLTCAGLENPGTNTLGESQHIDCAVHAGFRGLDGIVLVMDWASRTSQVVNLVDFNVQGEGDVMANQFKIWMIQQMRDIFLVSSEIVVDTHHLVATCNQSIN
jgi:hypothetical protein